jgi:SAM-dependent methyltransferase
MTPADDRYRSGRYGQQHPDWHAEDAPAKAAGVAELVRFGGVVPQVVVDVGCGTGEVLWHLSRDLSSELPDTDWEGWDIAPDAIARARQREGEHLHYVCGDLLASERSADLILALDVVEHVGDDLSFLAALRARARHVVFRFPLDLSVWDLVRPSARLNQVFDRYGHRHLYTRQLVLQRLQATGYRVVAERYHRAQPLGRGLGDRLRKRAMPVAAHATVRWLGGYSLMVLADAR